MAAVYYFLLGFFQLCLAASNSTRTPVVSTTAGDVVGVEGELDGKGYRVFKGIPYAEPPLGPLRFSDPIAKSSWGGALFNATSFGRSCPQTKPDVAVFNPDYVEEVPNGGWEIGEDCLTLNVYTPVHVENNNMTAGLAVMVWLHGGSYQHGQGSAYDVSALAVKGGVVVVTVNYRLGPFGFLFTGDDSAKGNYGLKDQQLALQWVRDNIMAFGGDPWRVTLFGQSDVIESVPLHLKAERSRSLFQRMAVHSPTWQKELGDDPNAEGLAGFLNCSSVNTSLLVDCLRGKSLGEILDASKKVILAETGPYVMQWYPVLNDDFFNTKPMDDIRHEFLSVFNSGDGSIGLDLLKESLHLNGEPYNLTAGVTAEQFEGWLRSYTDDSGVSKLAIDQHYISQYIADENFARMKALVDIYLDTNSIRHNAQRLDMLKKRLSSVFMMIFDHRSSVDREYPELELVPHGGELAYVFGLPFNAPGVGGRSFTPDELDLSNRMIKFWSNFAKTGNPNSNGTTDPPSNFSQPTIWPEYGDSKEYLQVRLREEVVGSDYRGEEAYFWNEYLPELNEAAREYCPSEATTETPTRPTDEKAQRTTTAVISDECDGKVVVGGKLGLALSPDQAETLIATMIFVGVALLCLIVLVFAVVLGYKAKFKGVNQKTEVSVEKGTASRNQYTPTKKHVVESGPPQAATYENVRVPAVHSIEINHKPDPNDSEDEAGLLQEKHAIPDSDDDEIPPYYASVDRSRRSHKVATEDDASTGDEEVNFPPPPDDWATKSNQEALDQEEDLDRPDTAEEPAFDENGQDPSRSEDGSDVSDPTTEPDVEDTQM